MARVLKRVARKDYPQQGIAKGDTYYKWTLRPGGRGKGITYKSKTYPKPQQLTNSEFMRSVYDTQDALGNVTCPGDLDDIYNDIEALGQEQQEKLDNMPEGLQQGPTGQLLQERVDGCEQWASDVQSAQQDWEQAESDREIEIAELGEDDEAPEEIDPTEYTAGIDCPF